jgi:methylmalonyl-CoA mutase N-terminal domain/subunit
VNDVAPLLSFFFNSHNSVFEEVAKFRAARRIWAEKTKEWYGAEADAARRLKFHTQTAGQSLTAQQPLNNIIRVTLQALAAVMGGTQSLHTNSYDEALALPSEDAVRVALRTQQILAEESGVADIVDPMAGSFAIEKLTFEMEAEILAYIEEIKELGDGSIRDGVLVGIEEGYFHREIQEASYEYQKRVDSEEEVMVGVNRYVSDEDTSPEILKVDDEVSEKQLDRLAAVKEERDDDAVDAALEALDEAIEDDENVMPAIVKAVKTYATMGEIMQVFQEHHGQYQERIGLA